MSTPTNDFQKLNIGGMPETRSQSLREQQGGGRTRATRGRRRGGRTPQASSRSDTPLHGHSGLLYNTQNLSPGSASRAAEGLLSEFFVDRLQRHESSRGTYYAFQLKKPVSVRIHDPEASGGKVECTCEDHQTTNSACVHIYVSNYFNLGFATLIEVVALRWAKGGTNRRFKCDYTYRHPGRGSSADKRPL